MSEVPTADRAAVALTIAIGTVGGVIGNALGLPLGFMLGALVLTAVFALADLQPFGKPMAMHNGFRSAMVPIIGVAIGANMTPDILRQAAQWWPSLCALLVFLPLAHTLAYWVFRAGGLGRRESFFGAVPGGLLETVQISEEAGADVAVVSVLHLLRLMTTIVLIPFVFTVINGSAVGSASGVQLPGATAPLDLREIVLLSLVAVLGYALGKLFRIPAGHMIGPVILSGVGHAVGLVEAVPPSWMIAVVQIIVGCGLGARFARVNHRVLARAAGLALLNALVMFSLALSFAWILSGIVGEPIEAVFLAFAPGGIIEMGLIALSLQMSAIYVVLHHVFRILLSVFQAAYGSWIFGFR